MSSIFSHPLEGETLLVHGCLRRAIAEYGPNPAAPRIIRRLLAERPDHFVPAALNLLKTSAESPGRDFMTVLLINSQAAIERITDPNHVTRSDTIDVIRRFMQADRLVDIHLARKLPARDGHFRGLGVPASVRVVDALDEVSPGARLIPVLGYLTRYPDARLAGKATKLVARRLGNPDWIRRHMTVQDARTRANLVEALWDIDAAYARDIYFEALSDPSSRVVGNALFGLHRMDEEGLEGCLLRMVRDRRAPFRCTAAWVMGRLGKQEYVEHLKRLLRDEGQQVRGAALRALSALRRASEETSRQLEFLSAATAAETPVRPPPAPDPPPEPDPPNPFGRREGQRFQVVG